MAQDAPPQPSESAADDKTEREERAVLGTHHEQGLAVYGSHAFDEESYAVRARLVTRRWFRGTHRNWLDALRSIVGADLYLASACHAGRESAWTRLRDEFRGRLVAVALRRGASPTEASEWADDTLADLSLPATVPGDARQIGRYSGRGALYSYLATLVLRRGADEVGSAVRRRLRIKRKSDAQAPQASHVDDGLIAAVGHETAERIRNALRDGMQACTSREHLVLVLKYRDGRPQTEIAELLKVGAPRVSRLVDQALRKVGDALRRELDGDPNNTSASWALVCDAVRRELAMQQLGEQAS